MAFMYYKLIQNYYENKYERSHLANKLFVENDVYEFILPYIVIIVAQRCGENKTCAKMCEIICKNKYMNVSDYHIGNWIYNMQFFINELPNNTFFIDNLLEYLEMLKGKGIELDDSNRNIIARIVRTLRNDGK